MLCVHDYGIQWDYLLYQSHLLQSIKLHPKHKRGTKYLVTRSPNDLGRVWIHDPYNKRILEIPVSDRDAKYAVGLTRYQHEQVTAYVCNEMKEAVNEVSLRKAMTAMQNKLMDYHTARLKAGIAKKMARFVAKQKSKVDWSKTIDVEPTKPGSGRLNVLNPSKREPKPKRSSRAGAKMPVPLDPRQDDETTLPEGEATETDTGQNVETTEAPTNPETEIRRRSPAHDDIEAIRARKNWDE